MPSALPSLRPFSLLRSSGLSAPRFRILTNNSVVKSNLMAMLLCFDTGTAPAVGYSRTITSSNVNSASVSNDWALLERQASVPFRDAFILSGSITNISLIAKGTLDGQRRGLIYQPATGDYLTDKTGVGPFTRAELVSKLLAGDTLTFMGVPLGSGRRIGIDRVGLGNLDGDGLPSAPRLAVTNGNVMIAWTNGGSTVLEVTDLLSPANWRTVTEVQETVGAETAVTQPLLPGGRFYRLRGL